MALEPPLWLQNLPGGYSARRDRSLLDLLFDEGVATWIPGGLAVTQRAAGANNSVDVAEGGAIILGDEQPDQGTYYIKSTDTENIPVTAAPVAGAGQHRIDLIYAQVHDSSVSGAADGWTIGVAAGTLVANAVAPPVPATPPSAIPLANLRREAGDASVTTARITSRRTAASGAFDDPPGTIRMHWTAAGVIPAGWAVCDGTNGTPDLRGRVPLGVGTGTGTTYAEGGAGGSMFRNLTIAQMPAHTHGAAAASVSHRHVMEHDHDINKYGYAGNHTHVQGDGYAGQPEPKVSLPDTDTELSYAYTGSAGHGHNVTIDNTGSGANVDMRQPYVALVFIMRLASVVVL